MYFPIYALLTLFEKEIPTNVISLKLISILAFWLLNFIAFDVRLNKTTKI